MKHNICGIFLSTTSVLLNLCIKYQLWGMTKRLIDIRKSFLNKVLRRKKLSYG